MSIINTFPGNPGLASTTKNGLMSATDKIKLDSIASGANKVIIDTALSTTSTNPVQNKVINTALEGKANTVHTHTKSQISDFPTSMPASDVSAWAKATTKPTYTASEVGADTSGSAAKALTDAKTYTDTKISALINSAPTTLDTLGEIATAMQSNASVVTALETSIGNKANNSDLTSHTGNTTVHITAVERTAWNAKASTSVATTSANGLMSSTDKTNLNNVVTKANTLETNLNAAIARISTLETNYNTMLAKLKTAVFI